MKTSQLALSRFAQMANLEGGQGIQPYLDRLGAHVGDRLSLEHRGAFRGLLLALVLSMQVALSRWAASQLHVDPIGADAQGGVQPTRQGDHNVT